MHRHGYKGRKFGRETNQRQALLKSLAESLIIHESIQTTLPKAKELVPYVEKLITKAKKADLHNRRQVIAALQTVSTAHRLIDEISPKLKSRTSGHLRVERVGLRRGDNAELAKVSFVDDLKEAPVSRAKGVQAKSPDTAKTKAPVPASKASKSKKEKK